MATEATTFNEFFGDNSELLRAPNLTQDQQTDLRNSISNIKSQIENQNPLDFIEALSTRPERLHAYDRLNGALLNAHRELLVSFNNLFLKEELKRLTDKKTRLEAISSLSTSSDTSVMSHPAVTHIDEKIENYKKKMPNSSSSMQAPSDDSFNAKPTEFLKYLRIELSEVDRKLRESASDEENPSLLQEKSVLTQQIQTLEDLYKKADAEFQNDIQKRLAKAYTGAYYCPAASPSFSKGFLDADTLQRIATDEENTAEAYAKKGKLEATWQTPGSKLLNMIGLPDMEYGVLQQSNKLLGRCSLRIKPGADGELKGYINARHDLKGATKFGTELAVKEFADDLLKLVNELHERRGYTTFDLAGVADLLTRNTKGHLTSQEIDNILIARVVKPLLRKPSVNPRTTFEGIDSTKVTDAQMEELTQRRGYTLELAQDETLEPPQTTFDSITPSQLQQQSPMPRLSR